MLKYLCQVLFGLSLPFHWPVNLVHFCLGHLRFWLQLIVCYLKCFIETRKPHDFESMSCLHLLAKFLQLKSLGMTFVTGSLIRLFEGQKLRKETLSYIIGSERCWASSSGMIIYLYFYFHHLQTNLPTSILWLYSFISIFSLLVFHASNENALDSVCSGHRI